MMVREIKISNILPHHENSNRMDPSMIASTSKRQTEWELFNGKMRGTLRGIHPVKTSNNQQ